MNKTKIGICTIGAVAILAGSCIIGSTYATNRTKADQKVTATAVRAMEPSNDTLKKAISKAVPEGYQVGDYQKDLCEDNFAQGGFLITTDKKIKLDKEAINQEWSNAGIIAKWDVPTLKERFNADGKKDEKEIVKDLLENLHTSVSKKSEPYGEDIAFDMSKDLYTAAYIAKLGDKAKNLESEVKYKAILLQEQNTIYALLFNKKYFDITSMKNVYDVMKVQSATASPIATEMQKKNTSKKTVTAKYTTTYKGNVLVNGTKQKMTIRQNKKDSTDTKISIDNKQVVLKRVSIGTGYAHPIVSMADVTRDGKKEMIITLRGGASGSASDIQVFRKSKKVWTEIPTPDTLWKDNDLSVVYHDGKIEISVLGTDKTYTIDYKGKESEIPFVGYRICKQKNKMILIQDALGWNTPNNKIGLVTQKLQYDKKTDSFVVHSIQVERK